MSSSGLGVVVDEGGAAPVRSLVNSTAIAAKAAAPTIAAGTALLLRELPEVLVLVVLGGVPVGRGAAGVGVVVAGVPGVLGFGDVGVPVCCARNAGAMASNVASSAHGTLRAAADGTRQFALRFDLNS